MSEQEASELMKQIKALQERVSKLEEDHARLRSNLMAVQNGPMPQPMWVVGSSIF